MRRAIAPALLIAGSLALVPPASPAFAQSATVVPPATPAPATPLETPYGTTLGGTSPDGVTTPLVPGNLSSTLSRSNGVLTPPAHVDPGMTTAAPATGPQSTPVIPPPGTPGGNRNVMPK